MGTIRCTRRELAAGLKIPLDERTTIVVESDAAVITLLGRAFASSKSFILPRAVAQLAEVFGFVVAATSGQALHRGRAHRRSRRRSRCMALQAPSRARN